MLTRRSILPALLLGLQLGALGQAPQSQEIMSGGRYVSGDQARRTFAAQAGQSFTIEVDWRDGPRTILADATASRLYEIRQKDSQAVLA